MKFNIVNFFLLSLLRAKIKLRILKMKFQFQLLVFVALFLLFNLIIHYY